MEWVYKAAFGVRARCIGHAMQDAGVFGAQGHGMPDSGAARPVVPMWLLDNLDIPVDEEQNRLCTAYPAGSKHTMQRSP